jgi:alpha-beta hydrolase superfamily lysophospholipase
MGLSTEHGAVDGYEAVELRPAPAEPEGGGAAMLRRRSARSSRRAVLYVHCLTDSFVPESLASWYAERGFHFYIADLRPPARPDQPADEQGATPDLSGCAGALDVMARHLRESEAIDTVVVSAHATGALIAALWCDSRRKASPAEALILADPALGTARRRHLGTGHRISERQRLRAGR